MKGTQPNMQDQMRKENQEIALDMTQKKEQVEQSLTKMGYNIIHHSPLAKAQSDILLFVYALSYSNK